MDNPDLYYENNCMQKQMVIESFEKFGSKIKWRKTNRIIDLGCGEGTTITALKKYFPKNATLIGCDISENMIKFADKHYRDENTSFIVLDISGDLTENFEANFSHVFSFYAIQWVKDIERVFNNIYNLLMPGGECFLVFPTSVSIYEVYRSFARNNKWSTWVHDVDRYITVFHDSKDPKAEVTKLLKNIGFDISVVEHKDIICVFKDMEDMKKSLDAINPFKIPIDKCDEFWEDYLKMWQKFNGLENNGADLFINDIKFKYKGLIIHARKTEDNKEKDFYADISTQM